MFEIDDPKLLTSLKTVEERLQTTGNTKGYMRYEDDKYYHMSDAATPNPWVVTTMWMAQYYIKAAKTEKDLKKAYELLEWTTMHATKGGVLAEQMHPTTGEHLSTAPLVWSHAEFVLSVNDYLERYAEFKNAT